jgi:hydroxymethylglutaryl-CoA synthase
MVLVSLGGGASLGTRVTRTHPFLDRYRGDHESVTRDLYDPRLFREEIFLPTLRELGEQLGTDVARAWSLPDPDGRLGAVVARQLGVDAPASAPIYAELGDTGAAAPLLGGIGALDRTGTVALVGFGGGRATALELRVKEPVAGASQVDTALTGGRTVSYPEVLRARGQLVASGETVQMGVPPESAQFVRGADEMLGLLGARCVDCGTINTPPSIHPHCTSCGSAKFVLEPLARRGSVHTFVVNETMPAPFVAPLPLAVVDLEDGARVMLQGVGDGSDLRIGSEVELVLRRYAYERGVPVYGYKVRAMQERAS